MGNGRNTNKREAIEQCFEEESQRTLHMWRMDISTTVISNINRIHGGD